MIKNEPKTKEGKKLQKQMTKNTTGVAFDFCNCYNFDNLAKALESGEVQKILSKIKY